MQRGPPIAYATFEASTLHGLYGPMQKSMQPVLKATESTEACLG